MIGTAILMLFGISGCACSVLTHSSSNFPCAIAYGFGLILAAIFAGPVSGAHINPAVSLSFSVIGKLKWNKLFHYIIAQYIGSFIGSLLAWTIYHESIEAFDKIVNNATSPSLQTASIFITLPSPYISLVPAIFDQILSTGLLVFGVLFVSDQIHPPSLKLLQALINGSLLMALIFGFGYNCGAILNPGTSFR
ncbi:aquaporin-10-like protein 1 [Sarcoptes scabiei]|uniref:Aquaporin-10-like protein 1 n=1 Tax=Sarcoptes scabiei TaxID=52283 RepID=A0A131ZWS9_SARSC|nr:aquaporin-10-like protein 1 [Sarcoptes scabiei]